MNQIYISIKNIECLIVTISAEKMPEKMAIESGGELKKTACRPGSKALT
jgi:hypothetical protein